MAGRRLEIKLIDGDDELMMRAEFEDVEPRWFGELVMLIVAKESTDWPSPTVTPHVTIPETS